MSLGFDFAVKIRRSLHVAAMMQCRVSYLIPYRTIPYHIKPYYTIPYHTIPYQTILSLIWSMNWYCCPGKHSLIRVERSKHTKLHCKYVSMEMHGMVYLLAHAIPYRTILYHTVPDLRYFSRLGARAARLLMRSYCHVTANSALLDAVRHSCHSYCHVVSGSRGIGSAKV